MDVWTGSILNPDGALQLLLLVDYVFDWARDIYRQSIIGSLRLLATGDNDAASMTQSDSAMLSVRHVDPTHMFPSAAGNDDYQAYVTAQRAFVARDSASCTIRHATFVEFKCCCVFATRDNVRTMIQSMKIRKGKKLCHLILDLMSEPMQLDESSIDAMEERWTGAARMNPKKAFAPKVQYHTVVSCTNYLTTSWHQVRELFVVAIADNAWDAVVEATELKPNRGKTRRPRKWATVDLDDLLGSLDRLQAGTPADTLLTCISRRGMTLSLDPDDTGPETAWPSEGSAEGDVRPSEVRLVMSDGVLRDTVHFVYTEIKRGSIEPEESFLRLSTRHDQQHLLSNDKVPVFPPNTPSGDLQPSDDGCVLVHGMCHKYDRKESPSTVCLYIFDGDPIVPLEQEITRLTKRAFETRDVHHTTRYNGTSNIMNLSANTSAEEVSNERVPWNIEGTYGIYSDFVNDKNELDQPILRWCGTSTPPDRQGSPRLEDGMITGHYLHERSRFPWSDPRLVQSLPHVRKFFVYKLITHEFKYWKKVATAIRRTLGKRACQRCAQTLDHDDGPLDTAGTCAECAARVTEHRDKTPRNRSADVAWLPTAEEGGYGKDSDSGSEVVHEIRRWMAEIGGYPGLREPFEDIGELFAQCGRFRVWSDERESERVRNDIGPSPKRRRLGGRSGSSSNAGEASESQIVDDVSESQAADNDSSLFWIHTDSDAEPI